MPDILSRDQVAALLDCEVSTIEEKARARELPGVKIGRSWIFPREALMKRLNEIALTPKPATPAPSAVGVPVPSKRGRRAPPALPAL